jgi:hypothetical protein
MKLKEFFEGLEKHYGITVFDFCSMKKLTYNTVKKYLNGEPPTMAVAKKIVKATGGKVTLKDLGLNSNTK